MVMSDVSVVDVFVEVVVGAVSVRVPAAQTSSDGARVAAASGAATRGFR